MAWQGDDADYQRLFAQSPVPTLVADCATGTILEANDAARALLDGAEPFGTPGADLLADLPVGSEDEPAPRVVRRLRGRSGNRTVSVAVLPPNADGTTFVQLHDITDLVSANASLLRHATDLEVRIGGLETVSARIAHDLRSPLATIAGFIDLLRSSHHELDEEQRTTILDRVSANAHRLAAMVSEMLDDARHQTGAGGSNAAQELLASVAETFDALKPDGAQLRTVPEVEDLPVPVGAVRQLVVNLVDNSIKFRAPDRPLSVEVRIAEVDGRVEIVVDDNGTGLGDDVEGLFESGVRGDNAGDVAGSGLGLSYARQAVEVIGGRLVAEPKPEGARFRVQLPAAAPVVGEAAAEGFAGGLAASQLDRIIDVAPVPMVIVDLMLQAIIRVNSAAVELLGVPADGIVGRPAADFLERPDRIAPLAVGGSRTATPAWLVTAGGQRVPVALWMVGFDDTALLIVQAQDLRGIVPDEHLPA